MLNLLSSESGFSALVPHSRTIFLPICTGESSGWAKEKLVGKHREMFDSLPKLSMVQKDLSRE